ncbi:MAG: OmpP1/FadL family transporter [Bacteroidales bacterium]
MKNTILLLLVFVPFALGAQNINDYLGVSTNRYQTTARATSMGNSIGALGGDASNATTNPAGLGLYRRSEFNFTTGLSFDNAKTSGEYDGSDDLIRAHINQFAYIVPFSSRNGGSLVGSTIGFGMNKIADFNSNMSMSMSAANGTSSLLDHYTYFYNHTSFEGLANLPVPNLADRIDADAALGLDLIQGDDASGYSNRIAGGGYKDQSVYRTVEQRGRINEWFISGALNFNNKLYLGATIGIQDLKYSRIVNHEEKTGSTATAIFTNGDEFYLDMYNQYSEIFTSGMGYNLKLGLVYRISNALRLGVAFHTPTLYALSDDYWTDISSYETNVATGKQENIYYTNPLKRNLYEYDLRTPLRVLVSGSYIIGKSASINAEYEYVSYNNGKFSNQKDFGDANQMIDNVLQGGHNFRVGGEYNVTPAFTLRGGYEYYSSAYKSANTNSDAFYQTLNIGFGYRWEYTYLDMAYRTGWTEYYSLPYYSSTLDTDPLLKHTIMDNLVMLTFGFRF